MTVHKCDRCGMIIPKDEIGNDLCYHEDKYYINGSFFWKTTKVEKNRFFNYELCPTCAEEFHKWLRKEEIKD